METKHTKGEWVLDVAPTSLESTITSTNGKRICDVKSYRDIYFNDPCEEERDANAKLIAAAPELLDACQFAVVEIKSMYKRLGYSNSNVLIALEQALKKATE